LGAITLLCSLGFWQLSRAQFKQNLENQWQNARVQQPLSLNDLLQKRPADLKTWQYQSVSLKTNLLNQYTILLDNKTNKSQVGYHVVVPAQLDDQTVILINYGWIPAGPTRTKIPTIAPLTGEVTIEGYLDFAYRNRFISSATESKSIEWPLRMQQLDTELLSTLWGKKIFPMLVILNEGPHQATALMSPARHRAYAFQWFSLAVTLAALLGFYYWKGKKS
jgi:surfeit locus 1 family protein